MDTKNDTARARGAFFLEGNRLYVANDGTPFDKKGVRALRRPNMSAKGDDKFDNRHEDKHGDEFIKALNEDQLDDYQKDPESLQEHLNHETQTMQDYDGRWQFELLQNIDDALGPQDVSKFIGIKGLGFISVLRIGENPAIFSGESEKFNFFFSREKTKEELLKRDVDQRWADRMPNFRVLWLAESDDVVEKFREQGFKTVIRLDIKEGSLEEVREDLESLDYHFLLFAQNIEKLQVCVDGVERTYTRKIELLGEPNHRQKHSVKITTNDGKKADWIRWQREWQPKPDSDSDKNKKRASCMFCLEMENGKCKPYEDEPNTKVYNFYPTGESSNMKGFLHLSFNLTGNRKRFLTWEGKNSWNNEDYHPNDQRLLDEVKGLIIDDVIGDDDVPAETVIEVFSPLFKKYSDENVEEDEPLKRVKQELIKEIKDCPFVPRFGDGDLCRLDEVKTWGEGFIDCLEEKQNNQEEWNEEWKLVPESLQPLFEDEDLRKYYEVKKLSNSQMLECLAKSEIKNEDEDSRTKLAELIASYIDNYPSDNFLDIKFLADRKGKLFSLNDDYFVMGDLKPPKFLGAFKLSEESQEDLKNYFRDEDNKFYPKVEENLISNSTDIFKKKFLQFIVDSNEDTWHNEGYEILEYAFKFFQKNKENKEKFKKKFEKTPHYNPPQFFVPSERSGVWRSAHKAFFSKTWHKSETQSDALKDWFEEHSDDQEFELIDQKIFLKEVEIKKAKKSSSKGNKSKSSADDWYNFLLLLGVHDTPSLKQVNPSLKEERWGVIREYDNYPEYKKGFDRQDGYRKKKVRYIISDQMFVGGCEFLSRFINKEDAIDNANKMIKKAKKSRVEFKREYARSNDPTIRHPDYDSLAVFQIFDGRWLKLKESPLNLDGLFAPRECFLKGGRNPKDYAVIFPTLSRKDLPEDSKEFIESLKLEDFSPTKKDWKKWSAELPDGYQKLKEAGEKATDELNFQITTFFKKFINQDDDDLKINFSAENPAPTKPFGKVEFEFNNPDTVLINDKPMDDELISEALSKFGCSLFILGKSDVDIKQLTKKLNLKTIEDRFSIKPNYLLDSDQNKNQQWLKASWDIFKALDKEFPENKGQEPKEEMPKIKFCKTLSVAIQPKDQEEDGSPEYISSEFYRDKDVVLIQHDKEDKEKSNLIKFLCNHHFKWELKTTLVKSLMAEKTPKEKITETLEENYLPKDFFEKIATLQKMLKELEEEQHQAEPAEQEPSQDKEATAEESPKQDVQPNDSPQADPTASQVDKPEVDSEEPLHPALQSPTGQTIDTSSTEQNNDRGSTTTSPTRRKGRTSGVGKVRENNSNDKNKKNSAEAKRIGKKAERIVYYERIKIIPESEKHIWWLGERGKDQKGFDIEYKKNRKKYFVEVKGLKRSWEESDISLSIAQFKKAEEQGDKFFLFIVEYVDDEKQRKIWKIKNPAKKLTEFEIDHGWKEFAEEKD